jgi:2-methylisocitrate lyase-like PEP mutase family enzyme
MATPAEKRATFRRLHEGGCFVLPNPWDAGSAKHLESLGFKALASTSGGFALFLGRGDYGVTRDEVLAHLKTLSDAVDLPINADFEGGFAVEPEGVAESVKLAIEAGVAGLSIEDRIIGGETGLLDEKLAVERVRAARAALDEVAPDAVLVARCEAYLVGEADLSLMIGRLQAYAEAGADCLYGPGVRDLDEVKTHVQALAPKPVNVLLRPNGPGVAELAEAGVRRVSVGGSLAYTAWRGFTEAAKTLADAQAALA